MYVYMVSECTKARRVRLSDVLEVLLRVLAGVLRSVVRSQPQLVYEQRGGGGGGVREALESATCLGVAAADSLLRAIAPLLRLSAALTDSLLLILRKALFSRSVSALVSPGQSARSSLQVSQRRRHWHIVIKISGRDQAENELLWVESQTFDHAFR